MIALRDIGTLIDTADEALIAHGVADADMRLLVRAYLFRRLRQQGQTKRALPWKTLLRDAVSQLVHLPGNVRALRAQSRGSIVVCPASHRNLEGQARLVSRHADALGVHLGQKDEPINIVEVGIGPGRRTAGCAIRNISLVVEAGARLLAAVTDQGLARRTATVAWNAIASDRFVRQSNISLRALQRYLARWVIKRRIYGSLVRLRPQVSYFAIVYYHEDAMALTCAANLSGCSTHEYQHGVQNDHHPMYAGIGSIAAAMPCTLPRHFLVWDRVAATRCRDWQRLAGHTELSCRRIGNLWQRHRAQLVDDVLDEAEVSALCNHAPVVLLALQEWPVTFNFCILGALQTLPASALVIVRTHPLWLQDLPRVRSVIDEAKLPCQVTYTLGVGQGVECLLDHCQLCITGYSTVGLDALAHGVRCVFTHPNALNGLAGYIDGEQCMYAETTEALVAAVSRVAHQPAGNQACTGRPEPR